MGNGNSADWIRTASRRGINLGALRQDKTRIFEILDELELPRPLAYYISGEDLDTRKTMRLFERHGPFFCRLVGNPDKRPYKDLLESAEQLGEFCSHHDMTKYTAMLVEKNLTHAGAIVAVDHHGSPVSCVVELVEGDGRDLFHGRKTPVHAEAKWTRTILYSGDAVPTDYERRTITSALKLIGGPSHPFPGYYEFDVHPERGVVFRNYQRPETIYATTPLSLILKESPL